MTPAANKNHYHQDKSSSKRLLPCDPVGQHFLRYFQHGWSFIESPVPEEGNRPAWKTERRYPLEPRTLWSKYLDEDLLLGLSFGKFTHYLVLDIDRKSRYHPLKSREKFDSIIQTLEEKAGLCRPIIIQSSESEGIHIYYFLSEAVHSFTLSITVKRILNKAGYRFQGGQLELFPNPKPYDFNKPTSFRSLRLPLQTGSYILDWDLNAISKDVEELLVQADSAASSQDMLKLFEMMEEVGAWHRKNAYFKRGCTNAEQWCFDLQEIIDEGWTGFGQTNDLLIAFGKYGVVFLGLSGEDLIQYMQETAVNSTGYVDYCRHQHEIDKRVKDVAKWAQSHYTAHPNSPVRDKNYREQFYSEDNVIAFIDPSMRRHEQTLNRIKGIVAMLRNQEVLPQGVEARIQAIITKSKEAFREAGNKEIGVSKSTLYKEEYKYLWHPSFEVVEMEAPVNADFNVTSYGILPFLCDSTNNDLKIEARQEATLQVMDNTEGLVGSLPSAGIETENQEIAQINGVFETEAKGEGERELEILELGSINNQSHTRMSLVLDKLITLNLYSIVTNSVTASNSTVSNNSEAISYLVKEVKSNSVSQSVNSNNSNTANCLNSPILEAQGFSAEELISSNSQSSTNSLVSLIEVLDANSNQSKVQEVINYLTELFSECGQCLQATNILQAPGSNTELKYKQNLLLFLAAANRHVLLCSIPSVAIVQAALPSEHKVDVEDSHCKLEEDQDGDNDTDSEEVTRQQWNSMKFKLEATQKAKKLLKQFCNSLSFSLPARERDAMEKFLRHCLLNQSPYQTLREEARTWFEASRELIYRITDFTCFWDYFEALTF